MHRFRHSKPSKISILCSHSPRRIIHPNGSVLSSTTKHTGTPNSTIRKEFFLVHCRPWLSVIKSYIWSRAGCLILEYISSLEYFNERNFEQETMHPPACSTSSRHDECHGRLLILAPRDVVTVHPSAYYMISQFLESSTQRRMIGSDASIITGVHSVPSILCSIVGP